MPAISHLGRVHGPGQVHAWWVGEVAPGRGAARQQVAGDDEGSLSAADGRRVGPARHPLDPLDAGEIRAAVEILRRERLVTPAARFVSVSLNEPAKNQIALAAPVGRPSADQAASAGQSEPRAAAVPREGFVVLLEPRQHATDRDHDGRLFPAHSHYRALKHDLAAAHPADLGGILALRGMEVGPRCQRLDQRQPHLAIRHAGDRRSDHDLCPGHQVTCLFRPPPRGIPAQGCGGATHSAATGPPGSLKNQAIVSQRLDHLFRPRHRVTRRPGG